MQKRLKKYQAQAAKMHGTGKSTVLTNELNANLANWEKYAAEWNAVKKNKANSTLKKNGEGERSTAERRTTNKEEGDAQGPGRRSE